MQIRHSDKNKNKAVVSLFFDYGDEDSEFLAKIGFDPDNNPTLAEKLY